MVIATYDKREQFISQEIANSGSTASSIYDKRLTEPDSTKYEYHRYVPRCIYFFYIRINGDGALKVDHYFYFKGPPDDPDKWEKILYDDVPDIVKDLALKARPSGIKNPAPLPDHNFANVTLRRKSYIAFFLDEANWAYHEGTNGRFAMAFNETKSGNIPNYSFFDAKDLKFELPIFGTDLEDTRTGIFLVNHMKWDDGGETDLQDAALFAFDMYFDVTFADPSSRKLTVIFDPGGTNQGPPEQP